MRPQSSDADVFNFICVYKGGLNEKLRIAVGEANVIDKMRHMNLV